MRRAAALGILVLLSAAGCEVTPSGDFTPEMSVHGIVWRGGNDRDGTPIFLNRTYGINETPANLLHGAEVIVGFRGDSIRFDEDVESWTRTTWRFDEPDSAYATYELFFLGSGDTVKLRVAHPDFDTLCARTVVPDTFWITYPESGDTVTVADSLVFRRSRGAFGYLVSFEASFQGDTFWSYIVMPQESIPGVPYDTLYERIPMVWLNYITPGEQALRVMAMDSNYYVWMSEQGRGPRQRGGFLSAGVENGVGVFGSGSEAEVEVFVSQDSADSRRRLGDPRVRGRYRPLSSRQSSR